VSEEHEDLERNQSWALNILTLAEGETLLNKVCPRCKETKLLDGFGRHSHTKDGLRSHCKMCHFQANKKRAKLVRKKRYRLVNRIKTKAGCLQCGDKRHFVLDYHHMDPRTKSYDISEMVKRLHAVEKIKQEIAKCILLCSNCHREAHYIQKKLRRRKRRTPSGIRTT
jgi:hypothetical protein